MMLFLLSCLQKNEIDIPPSEVCLPEHAPLRRLSAQQYQKAIEDLFSVEIPNHLLPQTTKGKDFRTWASSNPLSPSTVESMMNAAEYVAENVDITQESTCAQDEDSCLQEWLFSVGEKAYRRPLREEEKTQLSLFFSVGLSPQEATQNTIMLLLQHPSFLYYDGLKATQTPQKASSYQIAERFSFFLRNAPPDQELRLAAEQDSLHDQSILLEQARRLAQSTQAFDTLQAFHYDWLNLYLLDGLFKSQHEYPDFGTDTTTAMKQESALFVTETLWMNDPTFETLLLSQRAWLHPQLQASYSIEIEDSWNVYELAEDRLGILTRSAFLSAHASSSASSPVRRGAFILQEVLCEELSPPPEVNMDIPPPSDTLPTIRDRLAEHSNNPSCSGCHMRIDPVGYAFEHFGAMGEWREDWEGGQTIDASGSLDGNDFYSSTELLSWLATSPRAQRCYAKKWLTYALGRPLNGSDACLSEYIENRFVESGGDIQQLLIDISTSDAFLYLPLEQP